MPLIDTGNKYGDTLIGKLISNLVIQIFSFVAETERNMNQQRTKEGLKAAKARGVKLGRKSLVKPPEFDYYFNLWRNGQISEREAARKLGVSRGTFHKWAHE